MINYAFVFMCICSLLRNKLLLIKEFILCNQYIPKIYYIHFKVFNSAVNIIFLASNIRHRHRQFNQFDVSFLGAEGIKVLKAVLIGDFNWITKKAISILFLMLSRHYLCYNTRHRPHEMVDFIMTFAWRRVRTKPFPFG